MRTNIGARFQFLCFAAAASLWSMPVLAQAPSARLADKDVKTLLEQVDEGRDKFEGNLDSQFKGSTMNGPAGERRSALSCRTTRTTRRNSRSDSPPTTRPVLK